MSCRHLRSVLRPALGILLPAILLCRPGVVSAVTYPSMSDAAPVVSVEPIRIIPTPKPIESARPYQRYEGVLSDLEVGLFDDAIDSKWDSHTLLEAALIAGGVHDREHLAESSNRFDRLVEKASASIPKDLPPDKLARKLFEFMHRDILIGGYELECTDLAETLRSGQFNCVSSTVLFNCLAASFGLESVGMELPGHAMSRLHVDGRNMDVETTCPAWFRLQHDPKRRAALIAKTIGADLHGPGAQPGREVSPVELVAMIYYNRGVDLLMGQKFAEAAAANAKALRLDPSSETARGNLLATLNNWAITIGSGGRYEKAIDLLQQGIDLDPDYETFAANYVHLYYQWAESFCAEKDFEAALEVLGKADAARLGTDRLCQLRLEIYRRWAREMIRRGKSRQAMQLLQTAQTECRPKASVAAEIDAHALPDRASELAGQNQLSETESRIDEALDRQPEAKLLNEH